MDGSSHFQDAKQAVRTKTANAPLSREQANRALVIVLLGSRDCLREGSKKGS